MLRKAVDKVRRTWAFALAAISLPLSYLLLFPCFGSGCAGCPSGGACLFSVPLLVVLVLVGKSFARIKKAASRLGGWIRIWFPKKLFTERASDRH